MSKCEFCNSVLKNEAVLRVHKKTAKYCLKIQEKKSSKIYTCEYCDKEFPSLERVENHYKFCLVLAEG